HRLGHGVTLPHQSEIREDSLSVILTFVWPIRRVNDDRNGPPTPHPVSCRRTAAGARAPGGARSGAGTTPAGAPPCSARPKFWSLLCHCHHRPLPSSLGRGSPPGSARLS